MIGAMPAMSVRHQRRKKRKMKSQYQESGSNVFLLQQLPAMGLNVFPPLSVAAGVVQCSEVVACAADIRGALIQESMIDDDTSERDECCRGFLSLLHFIVLFILSGLIVLAIGVIQFKEEADLASIRFELVFIGSGFVLIGFILIAIKYFTRLHKTSKTSQDAEINHSIAEDSSMIEKGFNEIKDSRLASIEKTKDTA